MQIISAIYQNIDIMDGGIRYHDAQSSYLIVRGGLYLVKTSELFARHSSCDSIKL